ncbi:MAG: hypothetical protein FJ147_04140 [Deltaproteobacteria bacterium]|nr:hypothetical protein [Deltaproteobacteria bacterium]
MNIKAAQYESIQDMLTAHNYLIDQGHEWFVKPIGNERLIVIPFVALAGHSVTTFYEKAEQSGWLKPVEVAAPLQTPPPLYQFSQDQIF